MLNCCITRLKSDLSRQRLLLMALVKGSKLILLVNKTNGFGVS
jgi:hypothetical protein